MLSGSLQCLRSRTSKPLRSVVELTHTEPLLFLYPRWFRDAASKPEQLEETSHEALAPPWADLPQLGADIGLRSGSVRRICSAEGVQDVQSNIPPKSKARAKSDAIPHIPFARMADGLEGQTGESSAPRRYIDLGAPQNPVDLSLRHIETLPDGSDARVDAVREKKTQVTSSIRKVTLTRTKQGYGLVAGTPAAADKAVKRKALREAHDPKHLRWAVPLRLLANIRTKSRDAAWPNRGERLDLPVATLYELTGSVHQNAWIYPVREGCAIRVLGRSDVKENHATLSLRGSDRARELAKQYLQAVSTTASVDPSSIELADRLHDPIRPVLSRHKAHFVNKYSCRADAIYRPQGGWTVRSFAEYVETLTSMRIPAVLRQRLYAGTPSHNEIVAKCLAEVFSDPTAEGALSTRALNDALRFTCKHFEISSTADLLFRKARSVGLSLEIDTFNIMLEQALGQNDIHRFKKLLFEMQQLGIIPDGMTWVALLRATKLHDAQGVIISHIKSRSLMSRSVQRAVVDSLIETDFSRLAKVEGGLQKFENLMSAHDLLEWFSANSFARMLSICAGKSLWDTTAQLVDFSNQHTVQTKPDVLTHLFRAFKRRGSTKDSITLLNSHFAKTVGRHDGLVIPIVFMTAWNGHFYNVCRVLWHYAATHGLIPFKMRSVVALSLTKNKDKLRSAGPALWWTTAGKVIVGLDRQPSFEAEERDGPGPDEVMERLSQWTPDGEARQEQLTLAYEALGGDLDAWQTYVPMRSQQMFDLLREAYERDCMWMKEKVASEKGLSWMLEHAIDVPLRRRGRSGAS